MAGKLLTEGIGTFFLVLTIGLTVLGGVTWAPIAIGSALMVMVYMGGHISGAHYNPAVTLAVWLRGRIAGGEAVPYMATQLAGAIIAGGVIVSLRGESLIVAPGPGAVAVQIVLVEILFSFALALVVLNTATSPLTEGNSYYGLAIGFTVMVGASAGGDVSGGAFNPAVGLGPAVVGAITGAGFNSGVLIYYLVAPFLGGALAAAAFRVQHGDRAEPLGGS